MNAPHILTLDGVTYTILGDDVEVVTQGAPVRTVPPSERAGLPPEVRELLSSFWKRLTSAPREEREGDQWASTYRVILDDWSYTWLNDRKEAQDRVWGSWIDPVVETFRLGPMDVRFHVGSPPAGVTVRTVVRPRAGRRVDVTSTWLEPEGRPQEVVETWTEAQAAAAFRAAHPVDEVPTTRPNPVPITPEASAALSPGVYTLGPGRHIVEAHGPVLLRGGPGASLRGLRGHGDVALDDVAADFASGVGIHVEGGHLEVVGGVWRVSPEAVALRWLEGTATLKDVQITGADMLLDVPGGAMRLEGCTLGHGGVRVGAAEGGIASLTVEGGTIDQPGFGVRVEAGGRLSLARTRIHRSTGPAVRVLGGAEATLTNVLVVRGGDSGVVVHPDGRLTMQGGRILSCADRGIFLAGPAAITGAIVEDCVVGVASYAPSVDLADVTVTSSRQGGIFVYGAGSRARLVRCTARGSGDANLEVADGAEVESVDGVFEDGRAAGVHARAGAHVKVGGGRISGNAGAAVEGLDGGRVTVVGVEGAAADAGTVRAVAPPEGA